MTMTCSCTAPTKDTESKVASSIKVDTEYLEIIPGAERLAIYYPEIKGKKVGLVVNQTSVVGDVHLVDTLVDMGVDVKTIFAPEHGFRGEADAGEHVPDQKDSKTGISIVSLYGKKKGPAKVDMQGIDVMIFDIQDVGVRFYTFISTLHYVMQACADAGVPLILLDRPNPNAHYVDGPIMQESYKSFVGMHPVPIVYGMTIGEYGQMINGEGWLDKQSKCDLTVVSCKNYTHDSYYNLPIIPSPNLPNIQSIFLYPSLCLFEGTTVSVGRGTDMQFQMYGHPAWSDAENKITIKSMPGAKYPKHENKSIGYRSLQDLTKQSLHEQTRLNMSYIVDMFTLLKSKNEVFFNDNNFFEKLAGTDALRAQLQAGKTAEEISESWKNGVEEFRMIRENYLIYD